MQFHEDEFQLRNPTDPERMCYHLDNASDDTSYHSTTYGINSSSPLNTLQFYHVCDFGLPPDIMHDLLEGYVPYKVKLMLKYYIEERRLFKLEELNVMINNCRYAYMETKPTSIYQTTFASSNPTELNQSGTCIFMAATLTTLLFTLRESGLYMKLLT